MLEKEPTCNATSSALQNQPLVSSQPTLIKIMIPYSVAPIWPNATGLYIICMHTICRRIVCYGWG